MSSAARPEVGPYPLQRSFSGWAKNPTRSTWAEALLDSSAALRMTNTVRSFAAYPGEEPAGAITSRACQSRPMSHDGRGERSVEARRGRRVPRVVANAARDERAPILSAEAMSPKLPDELPLRVILRARTNGEPSSGFWRMNPSPAMGRARPPGGPSAVGCRARPARRSGPTHFSVHLQAWRRIQHDPRGRTRSWILRRPSE